MRLYLDSSTIVKLVQVEPESAALQGYLRELSSDTRLTCGLALVEVVRAVMPGGPAAVTAARRQLGRMHITMLDGPLLEAAAVLSAGTRLRSLDAIHVAAANLVAPELRALVTYDERMAAAAREVGLPVASPE